MRSSVPNATDQRVAMTTDKTDNKNTKFTLATASLLLLLIVAAIFMSACNDKSDAPVTSVRSTTVTATSSSIITKVTASLPTTTELPITTESPTTTKPLITTVSPITTALPIVTTTTITTKPPVTTTTAKVTTTTAKVTTTTVKTTTTASPTISNITPDQIVRGTIAWVTEDVELFDTPSMDHEVGSIGTDCSLILIDKGETASLVAALGSAYYLPTECLTFTYPADALSKMDSLGGRYYKGSNGKLVAIDAGHQNKAMPTKEPLGPGSTEQKAMLSSGTQGVATNIPEYVLNLEVALRLRNELIARGYGVLMIRETHTVRISNAERANIANAYSADIFIRIHANGSADKTVRGAYGLCMTAKNKYNGELHDESRSLTDAITDAFCKETGVRRLTTWETDTMTGINWAKMPVVIMEMGYMSNPDEDRLMATSLFRQNAAVGMANGIDDYFG